MPALSLCSSAVDFITPSSHECTLISDLSAARQQARRRTALQGRGASPQVAPAPRNPNRRLLALLSKTSAMRAHDRRQRHQVHSGEPQEEGLPSPITCHGEELPSGILFACIPGMRCREGWLAGSEHVLTALQTTTQSSPVHGSRPGLACAPPASSGRGRSAAFRPPDGNIC